MLSSLPRSLSIALAGALAAGSFSTTALADDEPAPVVVIVPEAPPAPVDPPLAPPPDPPRRARYGRWVFEVGLFAAYMHGNMDGARLDGDASTIAVTNGSAITSCAEAGCSYELGSRGSLAGGVSLFAGMAASDRVHVGGRVIAGPRLRGGMIFATGPSASIHVWGPFWAGASLLLGYASQSEHSGDVTAPAGMSLYPSDRYPMTASTGVAFGGGFELRCELVHTSHGVLAIDSQPHFLSGSPGSAFVLPVGLSYRFR